MSLWIISGSHMIFLFYKLYMYVKKNNNNKEIIFFLITILKQYYVLEFKKRLVTFESGIFWRHL